ncbi:MAG: IS630 family transposase [Phormidium tanganyikae FI6-MK23]|nr:IS630 family transposase [Phormidium tanganyikae FI6-MK23]
MLKQFAAIEKPGFSRLRYFAQDESRFGLKTIMGRLITALGVKPLGKWQWQFKAFWLYGVVEPTTGERFFLQFSHVDSDCYQRYLDAFSQQYSDSLNILQVDNGAFHKAKSLRIPDNVILLFQPAYCPELNPIERLWLHLKKDLRWNFFKDITELQTKVDELLNELSNETVASLTGYSFILDALSVASIL